MRSPCIQVQNDMQARKNTKGVLGDHALFLKKVRMRLRRDEEKNHESFEPGDDQSNYQFEYLRETISRKKDRPSLMTT